VQGKKEKNKEKGSKLESVAETGSKSDDILESTADLNSFNIFDQTNFELRSLKEVEENLSGASRSVS